MYITLRPGRECGPGKCVLTAGQCFMHFGMSADEIWFQHEAL